MLGIRSTFGSWREHLARAPRSVDFINTGQLSPDDFVAAGNYLHERFQTWDWCDPEKCKPTGNEEDKVEDEIKGKGNNKVEGEIINKIAGLDSKNHVLVCRGLPCHHRLDANFAGNLEQQVTMVADGEDFRDTANKGTPSSDEDGWLKAGNLSSSQEARGRDVRTIDESGNIGEAEPDEMDDIPDMDDDGDEGNVAMEEDKDSSFRSYDAYITYSALNRTPRLFLSGKDNERRPLPPRLMLEDIVGDYHDQTVTIEAFPHMSGNQLMVSIHPCKHASVMKSLINRANEALKRRRDKQRSQSNVGPPQGLEGLDDGMKSLNITSGQKKDAGGNGEDEWEVVDNGDDPSEDEVAIRVDQYLVVFLKFMASVIPAIELDNTMAI
ncbi:hypothetical protein VE03_00281 [Pseudogymnoascus sp. 23342-1-I1]|nr:hypothetical protein VE03_00281 [Pseudogymnoascus sp. 23342-1-I1]